MCWSAESKFLLCCISQGMETTWESLIYPLSSTYPGLVKTCKITWRFMCKTAAKRYARSSLYEMIHFVNMMVLFLQPITLYSAQQPHNMAKIGIEWLWRQTGMGATNHMHAGGFIRSKPGITHPDIQYHFLPSQVEQCFSPFYPDTVGDLDSWRRCRKHYFKCDKNCLILLQVIDHGRVAPECHAYQVHVGTFRETSRGWLKLKSKNPNDHPIIDANYLDTGT